MRALNLTQDQRKNAQWHVIFSVNRWEVYMGRVSGNPISTHFTKAETLQFLKQNGLMGRNVQINNIKRWLSE